MAPTEVLAGGKTIAHTQVQELGAELPYRNWGKAQNTGTVFLDMRNGREWVKQQAKDKTVLNLFAYTCAFSVRGAGRGGGKSGQCRCQ